MDRTKYLRNIPKVDEVLENKEVKPLLSRYPRWLVVDAIQNILETYRLKILSSDTSASAAENTPLDLSTALIEERIASYLKPHLRKVINATGVILHTNLGRSPLSRDALSNLREVASSYSNLEFDTLRGERGNRHDHLIPLLTKLTGAEYGLIVNNNAAAVFLALHTLASGREVVISRGELIEIGGSFRIPDVMKASGAKLVEVGTTNKTYLEDYQRVMSEHTALILKVHTSNYRILGFTAEVTLSELVALGKPQNIPLMNDLGSGSFFDLSRYGLTKEPTVRDAIQSGADVVTFSGDKLLGGPQAGIILGRKDLLTAMEKNPLMRALRVDKLTLSALESTLIACLDENRARDAIPTLRMLSLQAEEIEKMAFSLADLIRKDLSSFLQIEVKRSSSQVGGGALPLEDLPTWVVAITPLTMSVNQLEQKMRESDPPVIARISNDQILIDPRTLDEGEVNLVLDGLRNICHG
ncbi:MAG: L-seryl-tRNA(Sec) selenium transferase [Proteobacteria bacterium]|nr:L-seryl-tRNA(Sec) selenium transferase [Pseudomonadota bacterium]